MAHIRRKFYDVISALDHEALKKSRTMIGFNYCEKIYQLEKELSERKIKPFVIGIKNFLFANTSKRATCSAQIYSIIETAKSNNLIIEIFLVYLFENLVGLDLPDSESLENLIPWPSTPPATLKIKEKK